MYTLTASPGIIRKGGENIPADPGNRDYQKFLEWQALGNTPAPYVAPTQANVPCSPLYCRRVILTPGELTTLTSLAMSNIQVAQWLGDFDCSSYVLPADPGLVAGLAFMVGQGIFTAPRRDAIIAALTAGMPATWGQV